MKALPILVAALVLSMTACSSSAPRVDPTGKIFVTVQGESLDGNSVELPAVFLGDPVLLFVGYAQRSQFDIDRWLLGVTQVGYDVKMAEVPTIAGLFPTIFSDSIDGGMRSGIPQEDWAGVITVYDDADRIIRFTGNENSLPARVLLLDSEGKVVFFHDRGYSVGSLKKLGTALDKLKASAPN
jgi:hypothetical protein